MEEALDIKEGFIEINRVRKQRITNLGWEFQVKWQYGSTFWLTLKDIKESYQLEIAECTILQGLDK